MWSTGSVARSRPAFQGRPLSHNGTAFTGVLWQQTVLLHPSWLSARAGGVTTLLECVGVEPAPQQLLAGVMVVIQP